MFLTSRSVEGLRLKMMYVIVKMYILQELIWG